MFCALGESTWLTWKMGGRSCYAACFVQVTSEGWLLCRTLIGSFLRASLVWTQSRTCRSRTQGWRPQCGPSRSWRAGWLPTRCSRWAGWAAAFKRLFYHVNEPHFRVLHAHLLNSFCSDKFPIQVLLGVQRSQTRATPHSPPPNCATYQSLLVRPSVWSFKVRSMLMHGSSTDACQDSHRHSWRVQRGSLQMPAMPGSS